MAEDKNHSLIRRPVSSIEKVEPGAKRVLSGMVADTLALVKKDATHRPAFTAILGADQFGPMVTAILGERLGAKYNLRLIYFSHSSELERIAQEPFDLIFMYVGNIMWDTGREDDSYLGAAGILGKLKIRYGKPIIVTQGLDLSAELESKGIIFLSAPFSIEDFCASLKTQTPLPIESQSRERIFYVVICGIGPGRELDSYLFTLSLQEILGAHFSIVLQYLTYAHQWQAAAPIYDLFVIYLNPGLLNARYRESADGEEFYHVVLMKTIACGETDAHRFVADLKMKSQKPVIVLTNGFKYGSDFAASFRQAGADGFFSFLPPFPTELFKETLKRCVDKGKVVFEFPPSPEVT